MAMATAWCSVMKLHRNIASCVSPESKAHLRHQRQRCSRLSPEESASTGDALLSRFAARRSRWRGVARIAGGQQVTHYRAAKKAALRHATEEWFSEVHAAKENLRSELGHVSSTKIEGVNQHSYRSRAVSLGRTFRSEGDRFLDSQESAAPL